MRIHFPRRPGLLAFLLVTSIYVLVIVPAPGISFPGATHDDGLFMKWSVSILNGQWLGPWDNLTTSKGPLHSLLTAVAASLGVNPFAYKRLFYLAGSLVFVGIGLRNAPTWLKVLTLATLLLDPFQYGSSGLRNLREGTYIPLQLIAFGLGSWSLDQLRAQSRNRPKLVAAIIGTATCFGLMLVTREARLVAWLELSTWLMIGMCLFVWRYRLQLGRPLGIKMLAGLLSVFLIIGWTNIPLIAISALNSSYYGARISNSIEEGKFPILYGKLLSIRVRGEAIKPRVPVRKTTLDALAHEAAKVSPLSKMLKGIPSGWGQSSCEVYAETCGEIGGGWFLWALRDGISASLEPGASEASFQKVVQSANKELEDICKKTRVLICYSPKVGYMPALSRWGFLRPIEETLKEGGKIASLVFIPSVYPQGKVNLFRRVSDPRNLQNPLGIRQANLFDSFKWHRLFRVASTLGVAGKWILILLAIPSVCLASMRLRLLKSWDPVVLWMLFSLCLHLAVYTLLGLTSFPGDGYVIMASPLFIGLLARLSASLIPLFYVITPHAPHGNSAFAS